MVEVGGRARNGESETEEAGRAVRACAVCACLFMCARVLMCALVSMCVRERASP